MLLHVTCREHKRKLRWNAGETLEDIIRREFQLKEDVTFFIQKFDHTFEDFVDIEGDL